MKRPHPFANPAAQRRLAAAVLLLGGVLAALGAALRSANYGSATYYLDVLGWLTAVAGAGLEAKSAQLFLAAVPRPARRRAVAFAALGPIAALAGCVISSAVVDQRTPAVVAGIAMGGLVGGAGFGLAGLLSLGWYYGGDYAAGRIEKLSDEEW